MEMFKTLRFINGANGESKYSEKEIELAKEIEVAGGEWVSEDNRIVLIAEHSKQLQYDGNCDEIALEVRAEEIVKAKELQQKVVELTAEEIINRLHTLKGYSSMSPQKAKNFIANGATVAKTDDNFNITSKTGMCVVNLGLTHLIKLVNRA